MALGHGARIVSDGLVLYLDAANKKSYPTTGTVWTDLSGLGNNGTLTNDPTYSSANKGSIIFDGGDDYTSFISNPVLTNQITVDVWVNLTATTPNGNAWILGREGSYRLLYNASSIQWICATVNNGWYTTGTAVSTTDIVPTGNILNIVVTYDGTNNRIYVNGTLRTTGASISGNILTTSTYYLARSGAVNLDYGNMNMYSHKLYNRALTAAEVSQNFNALRGRYSI
jgi:hypothetical protein